MAYYSEDDAIQNVAKQQAYQRSVLESSGAGYRPADMHQMAEDSLATVAPRVLNLAAEVEKLSTHLEDSFGISSPSSIGQDAAKAARPTLIYQLRAIENMLSRTAQRLENINRHVNG